MAAHAASVAHAGTTSAGLLVLRLAAGGFLLPHGLGKLLGWFGGPGVAGFAAELQHFGLPSTPPLPLLLAALQTLLGLMVVVGAFTRVAALGSAAFLGVTVALNLSHGWFWMHGGIEYPLLWVLANLAVALTGAGALSIDALRAARTEGAHGR
ncbi:DoxX family protein [Pseudoxanthomonas sp. LjRoot125]|uniref:DoxX family protein n=1 Tax=Pseudoxanthomonas sp. LjRoot125 TaxID=3342258 RepID=UPI003E11D59A